MISKFAGTQGLGFTDDKIYRYYLIHKNDLILHLNHQ